MSLSLVPIEPEIKGLLFEPELIYPGWDDAVVARLAEWDIWFFSLVTLVRRMYLEDSQMQDGYGRLALVARRLGHDRLSLKLMLKDLCANRLSWWGRNRYSAWRAESGQWMEAEQLAEETFERYADATNVFSSLGGVCLGGGRFRDAILWFERDESAQRITPGCMLNYAEALAHVGEWKQSTTLIERAYAIDDTLKNGFARLGTVAAVQKEWSRGRTLFESDLHSGHLSDLYYVQYLRVLMAERDWAAASVLFFVEPETVRMQSEYRGMIDCFVDRVSPDDLRNWIREIYRSDGVVGGLFIFLGLSISLKDGGDHSFVDRLLKEEIDWARLDQKSFFSLLKCFPFCFLKDYSELLCEWGACCGVESIRLVSFLLLRSLLEPETSEREACCIFCERCVEKCLQKGGADALNWDWVRERLCLYREVAFLEHEDSLSLPLESALYEYLSLESPEWLRSANGALLPNQPQSHFAGFLPKAWVNYLFLLDSIPELIRCFATISKSDVLAGIDAVFRVHKHLLGRHCGDLTDKLTQYCCALDQARTSGAIHCLEIGTLYGGSSVLRLLAMRDAGARGKTICIDPFEGFYGEHDPYGKREVPVSEETVKDNLRRFDLEDEEVELRAFYSSDSGALDGLDEASFAFVMVDGDHSREGVLADWERVKELVRVMGYVVFDDYRSVWGGVTEAVEQILEELGPDWKLVGCFRTTVVIQRGK